MDFQRRAARTSRPLKKEIRLSKKMLVTQISLKRMENNVLKWYGYVV
jgi:hypothetical protein